MKLVLDAGNTFVKVALFKGTDLESLKTLRSDNIPLLLEYLHSISGWESAIMSAVIDIPDEVREILANRGRFVELTHETPIPVAIDYKTPSTLGRDRIAGVVAASVIYPGHDVLVIDAGTCITYDILSRDMVYLGGSISPGVSMRFKALHTFTGHLPLLDGRHDCCFTGKSTAESILSGVMNGVVFEMQGFINGYLPRYPGLKVVMSGGDLSYFDNRLKISIFASHNLVLQGLNQILDYNASSR